MSDAIEPSLDDIRRAAMRLGIAPSEEILRAVHPLIIGIVGMSVEGSDSTGPPLRAGGSLPDPDDNELGAWAWRCSVKESVAGPLTGRTIAVKDNIAMAGMPMANGTAALRAYVADEDATVVSRILAAGGEITGKAVCENLCLSAGSHTAASGPVRNPHDRTRSAGGSSSGCGALVASGVVDLAVGGDQGGSIRIPASQCGIVGHKPTYGLVPYTGAVGIEPAIDHLGPMARTVSDAALLLDVLAGDDGLDPRQRHVPPGFQVGPLTGHVGDLRIGVLTEGFGHTSSDGRVDELVRVQASRLASVVASVSEISVPAHLSSGGILPALVCQGLALGAFGLSGLGTGPGRCLPSLASTWGSALATAELPPTAVLFAIAGRLLLERDHAAGYGRAHNLLPSVTAAYDIAFAEVDVLLMPTVGFVAPDLPAADAGISSLLAAAFAGGDNVGIFDVTGHPAASIPCGTVDHLPVGMMLVGRHFEDATVLQLAFAHEQLG